MYTHLKKYIRSGFPPRPNRQRQRGSSCSGSNSCSNSGGSSGNSSCSSSGSRSGSGKSERIQVHRARRIGPLANRAERIEPGEPGQGNRAERLALGESGQANQAPGEAGPRIGLNINQFSNNMC